MTRKRKAREYIPFYSEESRLYVWVRFMAGDSFGTIGMSNPFGFSVTGCEAVFRDECRRRDKGERRLRA